MLRYLPLIFYFIFPNYKKVRDIYYDDVSFVVKYLQQLSIGEKVRFSNFLNNVASTTVVTRFSNLIVYKIAIYKKWDLKKEFLPTDVAWIAVDENNHTKIISFDKESFYHMIKIEIAIQHAVINDCFTFK